MPLPLRTLDELLSWVYGVLDPVYGVSRGVPEGLTRPSVGRRDVSSLVNSYLRTLYECITHGRQEFYL